MLYFHLVLFGGRSSAGRATDCGSVGRGFKPLRPPQNDYSVRYRVIKTSSSLVYCDGSNLGMTAILPVSNKQGRSSRLQMFDDILLSMQLGMQHVCEGVTYGFFTWRTFFCDRTF